MANAAEEERFPGHPLLPYLLILPSVAVIVVFLVYPFLQSVQESFFASTAFGTKTVFVGLRNYERLFTSPDFRASALATLLFAGFVMVIGLGVSLAVAQLLNQKIRGQGNRAADGHVAGQGVAYIIGGAAIHKLSVD